MTDALDDAWFDELLRDVDATAPADLRAAVMRQVVAPTPSGPDHPHRRWTWLSIAAAVALVVTGMALLADRGGSPSIAPPVGPEPTAPTTVTTPTTTPPTTPATSTEGDGATPTAPLRPTSFPIWPDDDLTVTSDQLPIGWGGGPVTVAVVERSDDRVNPLVIGVTPVSFETVIADSGGDVAGERTVLDGTTAQVYDLPGGTRAIVWEEPEGDTVFIVGEDSADLVDRLDATTIVTVTSGDGASEPAFALGDLPAGYVATVPPEYVPQYNIAAFLFVRDPFDRTAGVATIEASPYPGVLSALFWPPLEPTELVDGTAAWWTRDPVREWDVLTWQRDERTWVRVTGTDRGAILAEVDRLSWVDEDTWTARYGADDEAATPEVLSLEEITNRRARALAALPGYTATQTWTLPGGRGHQLTRNLTVLADGRAWAEDDTGSWWSADPVTGTMTSFQAAGGGHPASAQTLRVPDGVALPTGDLANFVLVAENPAAPLAFPPEDDVTSITIESTTHDRRPAWRITRTSEHTETTVLYEATYVIDVATGLIVEQRTRKEDTDGTLEADGGYELTDLAATVDLPVPYPGVVPEGVAVDDSFPVATGLRRATREDAAAEFDPPGLLVPTNPHGNVEYLVYDASLAPPTVAEPKRRQVTIRITDGFDRSEIVVTAFDADPALTIPDDDIVCYDLDTDGRCDHLPDGPVETVQTGALAGRKVGYGVEGQLRIFDAGRYIDISSTDLVRAWQLANELEPG